MDTDTIKILQKHFPGSIPIGWEQDLNLLISILSSEGRIEPVFINGIKEGFINNADGWGFSKDEISNQENSLLTLDIDFGTACSLNCPQCFRRDNAVDLNKTNELSIIDTMEIIRQSKRLGLKSVKFLGVGDPLEDSELIPFLQFLNYNEIIPLIFTKGYMIAAPDRKVTKVHGKHGVKNGVGLVKKLKELNVTILFGYNSFNSEKQNKIVGGDNKNFKKIYGHDYSSLRDRALKILVQENYNEYKDGKATKLAFAMNPVTEENIDEIYAIYIIARLNNIYPIVTPTMMSGRGKLTWTKNYPQIDKLINLYYNIYKFNLDEDIHNIQNNIDIETISPYAGGHVCNQTATGLYITLRGTVLSCPGNDNSEFVEGEINRELLHSNNNYIKELWENSNNFKSRKGKYNCRCIAKDGYSIPKGFYNIVIDQINNEKISRLKSLLNKLEYKIMFDYYKDHYKDKNKYIGISIQLESEEQDEYSPTRLCNSIDLNSDKLINNFCSNVQKNKGNVELCDKLDFYLKRKLIEENKKNNADTNGFACKCHKGVSNVLFTKTIKTNDNNDIKLYVFIGHFLLEEPYITTNKIIEIKDTILGIHEKKYIKPNASLSAAEIRQIYTEKNYNISRLNNKELQTIFNFVDEEIKDFFEVTKKTMSESDLENLQTEYNLCKENITIPKIQKSLKRLKREHEKLWYFKNHNDSSKESKNTVQEKEVRKKMLDDLLNAIEEGLSMDNIKKWKDVFNWTKDGIEGKILDDKWEKQGRTIL